MGGSRGLVLMWEDPWSRGPEFESQHQILDGHFSHYILYVRLKNIKNKWKEGKDGPFEKWFFKWPEQSNLREAEFEVLGIDHAKEIGC